MDAELAGAIRENARLLKQASRTRRALRALQDAHGRRLGAFTLSAGEPICDSEILDFLRLAVGDVQEEVQITVTARPAGTDTNQGAVDALVQC